LNCDPLTVIAGKALLLQLLCKLLYFWHALILNFIISDCSLDWLRLESLMIFSGLSFYLHLLHRVKLHPNPSHQIYAKLSLILLEIHLLKQSPKTYSMTYY